MPIKVTAIKMPELPLRQKYSPCSSEEKQHEEQKS